MTLSVIVVILLTGHLNIGLRAIGLNATNETFSQQYINCSSSYSCKNTVITCNNESTSCHVTCSGASSCMNTSIITNSAIQTDLNVLCSGDNSCKNIIINSFKLQNVNININCNGNTSCRNGNVFAIFVDNFNIECHGNSSCENIWIDVSYAQNVSIMSNLTQTTNYLGITNIQCVDVSICEVNISSNIALNKVINFCKSIHEQSFNVYYGDKYSQFDNNQCSNNHCCNKNIFHIENNNYDKCINVNWNQFNDKQYMSLSVISTLIATLSIFVFVFIVLKLIKYYRFIQIYHLYRAAFKPPTFILEYIHLVNLLVHITIIYIFIGFVVIDKDLTNYCATRYPNQNVNDLCDADNLCQIRFNNCSYNQQFLSLTITFHVIFFGFYCIFEGLNIIRFSMNPSNGYFQESFVIRHWQIRNNKLWETKIIKDYSQSNYFKLNLCTIIGSINHFTLLTIGISSHVLTANYFKWFALYPSIALLLLAEYFKIFYKKLPKYQSSEEAKLVEMVIMDYFGDVGQIIISYLPSQFYDNPI